MLYKILDNVDLQGDPPTKKKKTYYFYKNKAK